MSGADLSEPVDALHPPLHEGVVRRVLQSAWGELKAERERWPLWLPAFFAAGIASYFALTVEPSHPLAYALAAALLAALFLARRQSHALIVLLPLAVMALGFSVAAWRTDQVAAPRLEKRLGPVAVSGRVVEVEQLAKGRRVTLDQATIERLSPERTPVRVRVRIRDSASALRPGDRMALRAVLLPPAAPVAPGAFDFQRHAYYLKLGAVGYGFGRVTIEPSHPSGVALWIAALRDHIAARVTAGLAGAEGGIAAALMTGERGAIPADVVEAMRDSGLAHLLAIAGLHLGMVTGALFFGVRALLALVPWIALRFPTKKWAALAALVGAGFYLLITGGTVPTQRAFIMTGVVLLGVLLDRTSISLRMLCWAAVAILLIAPESITGPSFQLSFSAVLALLAAYESLRVRLLGWMGGEGWWRLPLIYLGGVAFTSLVTSLATIPYSIYHFDRLAAFGVVTNLIAVPVTALWVMPWAIVAYVLMPFGLEGLALPSMGWGLHAVIWSAKTIVSWPGSVAILPAMPLWGLLAVSFGMLWLCLWQRPWRVLGAAAIALGLASIALERQPDVIVSGDGRLFAVRAADGRMLISPVRGNDFDVETIEKRAGQTLRDPWPEEGSSADGRLSCDGLGCLYRAEGQLVALVREREALFEDCGHATVMISAVPVKGRCPAPQTLIDRFTLWREGGHALWLTPAAVTSESVRAWRGARPWVPEMPERTVSAQPAAKPQPLAKPPQAAAPAEPQTRDEPSDMDDEE
ncbi:MAG: ComEC/Rec2 family competence protein [Alphaproteobacteria bacterium]